MRVVLDPQTRRRIDIVEHLSTSKHASIEELMNLCQASDKTVLSDLNFIQTNWGQELQMKRYRDVYYFEVQNIGMMNKISKELFSKSLPLNFILELYENPSRKMTEHAQKLHVSESSLYRLLPSLNTYFKSINIEIKNHQGNYYLDSQNECHLRHFMTAFYLQVFYIDEILKQNELSYIEKVVQNIFDYHGLLVDQTEKSFYLLYYKISLEREIQGFKGPFTSDHGVNQEFEHIASKVEGFTKNQLRRVHGGVLNMLLPRVEKESRIVELKNSFVQALNLKLNGQEDQMLHDLCANAYTYITFYPFQVASLFDRYHFFTKIFMKANKNLYSIIERTVNNFARKHDKIYDLSLDYFVFYLNIYFYQHLQNQQKIQILVVSELGDGHSLFLGQMLKSVFSNCDFYMEDVYPLPLSKGSNNFERNKYDLVLSTAILENLDYKDYHLINDYPSINDLTMVAAAIQKKYSVK